MALRSSPSAMATSTSSMSARPAVRSMALPSASTCSARRICAAPQQHHHQLSAAPKLGRSAASSWVARSSTETQQPASPPQAAPVAKKSAQPEELVPDTEFSITKVSYGSILTPVGVGLLAYGFGAFFQLLPGADLSSLMLIYGFPISLLGFALSYAQVNSGNATADAWKLCARTGRFTPPSARTPPRRELGPWPSHRPPAHAAQLKPVPCKTTKAAFELRASQMTDIQKQVREDVTRFRCAPLARASAPVATRPCQGAAGGRGWPALGRTPCSGGPGQGPRRHSQGGSSRRGPGRGRGSTRSSEQHEGGRSSEWWCVC